MNESWLAGPGKAIITTERTHPGVWVIRLQSDTRWGWPQCSLNAHVGRHFSNALRTGAGEAPDFPDHAARFTRKQQHLHQGLWGLYDNKFPPRTNGAGSGVCSYGPVRLQKPKLPMTPAGSPRRKQNKVSVLLTVPEIPRSFIHSIFVRPSSMCQAPFRALEAQEKTE